MRKALTLLFAVLLIITVAACSATAATPIATGSDTDTQAVVGTPSVNGTPGPFGEVPTLTRLLIGTLKLEDSEFAITPEQAKSFIPLWQAVNSLSGSDTAASAEMTAVEKQIQKTFTAEQTAAIEAMQITRADLQTLAEELGITFGQGNQPADNGTPSASGVGGFPGGGGAPPDGGGFVPGGGGFGPGGAGGFGAPQNLTTEQQATMEARRASRPSLDVPAPFVEALISWLEAKAP